MSLEHVPKFVWYPIASLAWAFFVLILVLTFMSARAKWFEIDFLYLAIKVESVDQQISIAQQKIFTTMDVINGVTKRLNQLQSTLESVSTSSMSMSRSPSPSSKPNKSGYGISQSIMQQLQMQKIQLEGISDELKHVQDNLQSFVQKKYVQ